MILGLNVASGLLKRTGIAFFLLSLSLLSAQPIAAQPGDRRTPQQIRKDLEDKLADVEKQMADYPDRLYLYEARGRALTDLFRITRDRTEQDSLAERAFADFDRYEELTKGSAISARAELHQLIWMAQAPNPRRDELTSNVIEAFRHSPHFESAVSAYLEMIRARDQPNGYAREDDLMRQYYATVANLYLYRAELLTQTPDAVKAMYEPQQIWEDFDKAVEYRKRSIGASGILFVCDVYTHKGQAAYALGEYEIALDAYQAAEDYLTENWERYCGYHGPTNCESSKKTYLDWVSLLRARAYLKKGDYEKAISNLDYYITKGPAFAANCAQFYRMRAQAYRKLGKIELALADEKKAGQLSDGLGCN